MRDLHKILTQSHRLKRATRGFTSEEIANSIRIMKEILLDKKEEEKQLDIERKEKQIKVKELLIFMEDNKLTLKDIPYKGKEPKYKISYKESGIIKEKLWSGVGRMPKVLKNAINNGKKLEDYLI